VLWDQVRSLYGQSFDARIFTCSPDNQGKTTIRFADGINGARLPSGRDNIRATYRNGLGCDGNVAARTLTTLLDRPVGLKKAFNPGPALGGAEPENISKARTNAPNTVRTFGRIVSLTDFEDCAREYAAVAKARATWVWDGIQQAVHLTVAGDDGAIVTDEMYTNLIADLNARRHPHRKLQVARSYGRVAVQVSARLLIDPDHLAEEVQSAAVRTLQDYFDFERLDLGQSIHLSGVFNVLQRVPGVTAVDIDRLQYKDDIQRVAHGATTDPVQKHLPIYSARITCPASGTVAPAEMAFIETPAEDIAITTP
jgi:predicted phage baseplate assembly protein